MKKNWALPLGLILAFSLIACGGKKDSGAASDAAGKEPDNLTQNQSANMANSQPESRGISQSASSGGEDQGWPTGKIYEVPEWIGITKYYGGGRSLDDFADRGSYSMSVVASEDSLNRYLDTLEREGFEVSDYNTPQFGRESSAERGLVRLEISSRRFGEERGYQIDFELRDIGLWPRYNLPDFIFPLQGKMLVDDPVLYRPGVDLKDITGVWVDDTGYNFQFTYTGLTMFEAVLYMNEIASKLTNGIYFDDSVLEYGGFGFIKGTGVWDGQNYYVYGEVVEQDRNTYIFYLGWATNDMGW